MLALSSVLALATASAALAAPWELVFRESGTSAFAQSEYICIDNGDGTETCSSSGMNVFAGRSKQVGTSTVHEERICYSSFSDTIDSETGEFIESAGVFGCAFDSGTLTVDDLSSISVAATDIPLVEFVCDLEACTESPGGTAVVTGAWTGNGPISSQRSKSRFDDGQCVQVDSQKTTYRQAEFTGTADGDPFEAEFAEMSEGTFSFRTDCAFE